MVLKFKIWTTKIKSFLFDLASSSLDFVKSKLYKNLIETLLKIYR